MPKRKVAPENAQPHPDGPDSTLNWSIERRLAPLCWTGESEYPESEMPRWFAEENNTPSGRKLKHYFQDPVTDDLGGYVRWLVVLEAIDVNSGRIASALDRTVRAKSQKNLIRETDEQRLTALLLRVADFSGDKDIHFAALKQRLTDDLKASSLTLSDLQVELRPVLRSAFHYLTGPFRPHQYFLQPHWLFTLLTLCLQIIRTENQSGPITVEQILTLKMRPAPSLIPVPWEILLESIDRFREWLGMGSLAPQDDLARLRAEVFVCDPPQQLEARTGGSARKKQLNDVLKVLTSPSQISNLALAATPLQNVWSTSNWTGLRAFATRAIGDVMLRKSAQNRERSVHREKLRNGDIEDILLPRRQTVIYVPLSRASADGQRTTRVEVVNWLAHAFGLEPIDAKTARHLSDDVQVRLAHLRTKLTLHRTIIVMDGIEPSPKPFGAVNDVLKHTDWVSFVRVLMQPDHEAMRQTKGEYRSRFLALSGAALDELRPWMNGDPIQLADMPDPDAITGLLIGTGSAELLNSGRAASIPESERVRQRAQYERIDDLAKELAQQCAEWPITDDERKGIVQHDLSLAELYGLLPASICDLTKKLNPFPSELDLSLAWCRQKTHAHLIDAGGMASKPLAFDADTRLRWFRDFIYRADHSPAEIVALQLIALSVNGLRTDTLARCMRAYASRIDPSSSAAATIIAFAAGLSSRLARETFQERFRALIVSALDEEMEHVVEDARWFELGGESALATLPPAKDETQPLFDLRVDELRDYFYADLISLEDLPVSETRQLRSASFDLLERVLAEEAIGQATAQIRRAPAGIASDVFGGRRFVQAIFHGVLSLSSFDFTRSPDLHAGDTEGVEIPSAGHGDILPDDTKERFLFIYELIYRRCLENAPEWATGRSLGRGDIRAELLSMFADPALARSELGRMYKLRGERLGSTKADQPNSSKAVVAPRPRLPAVAGVVGRDLLRSMLQSSLDVGDLAYASNASDMGAAFESVRSRAQALTGDPKDVPAEGNTRPDTTRHETPDELAHTAKFSFSLAKIAIDARQARLELEAAESICVSHLDRLNVRAPIEMALQACASASPALPSFSRMESCLLDATLAVVHRCTRRGDVEQVSDIMYRLGEIRATRADFPESSFDKFGYDLYHASFAAFWIAEKLRSHASLMPQTEIKWPTVTSRAMRYLIRVSLKMAKISARLQKQAKGLDQKDIEAVHAALSTEFFLYARRRIDVYSRHLFRSNIERLHTVMLMSAAARVQHEIIDLTRKNNETPHLEAAWRFVKEAESLLYVLGNPDSVSKRFLLERIKTLRIPDRLTPANRALLARDLTVLKGLAEGSRFWSTLVDGLEKSVAVKINAA